MYLDALREKANMLPLLPGVYIMLDEKGEVIYVGKAKALKNRVTSYFRGSHQGKVQAMIDKVADFNVIVAANELEALVLENSLIKRHQPHYNILLRDDKGYPFIRLDVKSAYPRFAIASRQTQDGARYFGPYGGRSLSFGIIDTICKTLRLPTCSRRFPRDIGKDRPCLNQHLGVCEGWCTGAPDQEEYRKLIRQAERILDGDTASLTSELTENMNAAAEELNFELAAKLRDRIRAIESLQTKQRAVSLAFADMDAVGFYRGAKCCFTVMHYTAGVLSGKDHEFVEEPLESDAEAISSLVRQYYVGRGSWPKLILLPVEIEDREALEELLSQSAQRRVRVETAKRGDRRALAEAAQVNAREEVERASSKEQKRLKTLEWLQKTLDLPKLPERIEAFDISNLGSTGIVAAMTVFEQGKPRKKDYRKFRVESVTGHPDDYASMSEVLTRRFRRYLDGDEKFGALPDLLLIDGGATHAAAASAVLRDAALRIPVYGMVKDDRHRTRALITEDGREVGLSAFPAVFALIGKIQEETHRFAIEYQRSLRSASFASVLDAIPGVGEKRRNALLQHFKSVRAIEKADVETLCAVVPKNTAQAVWTYFHKEEQKCE